MMSPIWFDLNNVNEMDLEAMRGKRIRARAPLPDGHIIEGIGDIWVRIDGTHTKGSVSIMFDCLLIGEGYHIIDLKAEQVANIVKCDGDADFVYVGDLVPSVRE